MRTFARYEIYLEIKEHVEKIARYENQFMCKKSFKEKCKYYRDN
jgi:hypothetical protein